MGNKGTPTVDTKSSSSLVLRQSLKESEVQKRIQSEWQQLLCRLPDVVWRNVFKFMTSTPDDFERTINSNPAWRHRLLNQRTTMLFSKVFDIIGEKYDRTIDFTYIRHPENISAPVITHCKLCGRRRRAYPFAWMLNLRLVCKAWSKAIDNYCRRGPALYEGDIHGYNWHWSCEFQNTSAEQATGSQQFVEFLEHFQPTHGLVDTRRSPFIGNAISLKFFIPDAPSDCYQKFYDNALAILSKYGHHVETCTLKFDSEAPVWDVYYMLRQLLPTMPALKYLFVAYINGSVDEGDPVYSSEDLEELLQAIHLHKLPALENVKTLTVCGDGEGNNPYILDELIRSTNRLTQLELEDFYVYRHTLWQMNLPHLRELRHTFSTEEDIYEMQLASAKWPLEVLQLDFENDIEVSREDWLRLIAALHKKCGETLIDLSLILPWCHPKKERRSRKCILSQVFKFTRLQSLRIYVPMYSSLDFLLRTRITLTCLDIHISQADFECSDYLHLNSNKGYIINLFSYIDRPLDSNIWEHLPNLKILRLFTIELWDSYKDLCWECTRTVWTQRRISWS